MLSAITENTAELSKFCRLYHVTRLDIYGEAANSDSLSDGNSLTFVVRLQALPPGDYADAYFGLLESLEMLFGQPVELATDSSIENPYLRQIVEDSKVNLYAA